MQLGIFAKVFVRPTWEETLTAVAATGLRAVHFNMKCVYGDSLPEAIDPAVCYAVRARAEDLGLDIVSISGTFNMAHPDAAYREACLQRFKVLAEACPHLGVRIVSLCTGTRDPNDMWRAHPDTHTPEAWRDMRATLDAVLELAEAHDLTLVIETEVANVIDTPHKARRLLDEVASPRLKIIMDAANLFHHGQLARMHEVIDEAVELLGPDIVLAHAKDLERDGEAGQSAAGTGLLDYDCYLRALKRVGFDGPLLLHSLTEAQVPASVAFLREKLAAVEASEAE
ncbi:sugar phosphate isomerase/epimerase [Thermostilla marina]